MENIVRPDDSAYSKRTNAIVTLLFLVLSIMVFLPILLVFIVSISTMESITNTGYSFFPKGLSLDAYRYLMGSGFYLARAFLNSVFITIAATIMGLFLMCPIAYAISRKDFRYRRFFLIFLMIPMLFSGGMVANYMINTQVLHLRNTYFALILPGLCSTWYILILRNYFQSAIPDSLIESASLDGCRHPQIFLLIVAPVAKPVIMTVAVLQMFTFWNSWYPALLYIDSNHTELYPLQYVLVNMERSIDAITKDAQYMSGMQANVAPAATIRMAMVVIVVLPVMILFPFFQKFLTTGMTVGAVKG
ncbi:carbohydrate ABC transporter permease [Butyrivibrio sp. AE3004]|uniref:carbohydrate ABC transporter permease n=1 Tax=Butyrivibrio sp. AE3004 TaxID=1506994 RepID=UPI0006898529|nr:carbohydrate ABC transporter permease [Butyrivibrio sp. AE3004]